ncbi:MAG: hypothetical protein JWN70_443 [Planctomycetaceae bacterium]|nr:hypothetical protein [Planctomycetaceae bacterium]
MLLTPIHTGTHFVRLLLESHPSISLASAEVCRIDPRLRPDLILPGLGEGCYDATVSPDRESDRGALLIEDFERVLQGQMPASEFCSVLKYRESLFAERIHPLRISKHSLSNTIRRLELALCEVEVDVIFRYRGNLRFILRSRMFLWRAS